MANSSYPTVRDYLYAQVTALFAAQTDVRVSDGWPVTGARRTVRLGFPPEGTDTDTAVEPAQLGADQESETYRIPGRVSSWVGGAELAVKTARDEAFAMFDTILTWIRTTNGRTMGGALNSNIARIESYIVAETSEKGSAAEGRRCEITFTVLCVNRL